MLLITWPRIPASTPRPWPTLLLVLLIVALWVTGGACMTDDETFALRQDTTNLFYHGFDNYMKHAFPEDELKPISCRPQTRNRADPADIGLNDVLGNYSLTLIDSLSTLAILASGESENKKSKRKPLRDFQDGVKSLVELYGDGTKSKPCGTRACGFDLDSKVQVFETNIRGVGGLLSAHLFAVGDLPIEGYNPIFDQGKNGKKSGIKWKNGFRYDGQLLHLAHDLASRLLPAFATPTDIPYPRVNLRTGIPFYQDAGQGVCLPDGTSTEPREITENCAAGAGSLVLEFSTLSRLTGDMRFENLAKRAFWAIWQRRSPIVGLLGNGIDAESGHWIQPIFSGVGAGIDSFFEYSMKSHILLSGLPYNASTAHLDNPDNFLSAWQAAHGAVKRHVYRSTQQEKHPFYGQVDFMTGASRFTWIDNLSAYYPGLLVLAGELEEAIETHLLYSALWTRYGALPERWHTANSFIDQHFKHWPGRPEFIESTFYLYQATKDPYYLHVGEMVIRDIRRRCWTKCGWTDLADVMTGEQRDRMESFFLGETAKYLYLLFSKDHPLNRLDRPIVFTTEGHPLVLPDTFRRSASDDYVKQQIRKSERESSHPVGTCAAPLPARPLTVSNVAARHDLFHAASMAQLHLVPVNPSHASSLVEASPDGPGISVADIRSPTNYTYYPWTLPQDLVPTKGTSSPLANPVTSTLTFPATGVSTAEVQRGQQPFVALQKIVDGVIVDSLSNLRLNMIQESKSILLPNSEDVAVQEMMFAQEYRIHGIAHLALGRDEKVLLTDKALQGVSASDPNFTRVKDLEMVDLVLDVPSWPANDSHRGIEHSESGTLDVVSNEFDALLQKLLTSALAENVVRPEFTVPRKDNSGPSVTRHFIPAILPTGAGTAPLPDLIDNNPIPLIAAQGQLPFSPVFYLSDNLCSERLPAAIAKSYNILVLQRGGCSFNDKLSNIASYAPAREALQLVIVISTPDDNSAGGNIPGKNNDGLIRPLLDLPQLTPNGVRRRNPIAMVMVQGTAETIDYLQRVASAIGRFDDSGKLIEAKKESVGDGEGNKVMFGGGLGVKRRYWFESMGVPISNLMMV